ncbi:MAG: MFS transporter [Massilia sp.]
MNAQTMPAPQPRGAAFANANFRWLMSGACLSMVGDQFTLIALPWLVLRLTGDPLALGLAIALMSVPRAAFILLGGALVDRYSPKRVMLLTKYASTVLLGALAALTLAGQVNLPMVYGFALAIGLSQAFAIPSGTSMLPRAMPPGLLQAANGAMMGLRQIAMLAGPLLAALMMALASNDGRAGELRGLGLAFAIDCLSFVVSAWTLSRVALLPAPPGPAPSQLLRAVADGVRGVWRDQAMRSCFLYWGVVSFFVGGSLQVALPVLASDALHSASAFGVLMGAHGAGTLLGMALSALTGKRLRLPFGAMILLGDVIAGLLIIPLGAIGVLWQGVVLLGVLGMLMGFMQVAVFTWIQQRVALTMMGRVMSIFMFIFMGLAPLSAAFTGSVLQFLTLAQLFACSGMALLLCALLAGLLTPMGSIRSAPAGQEASPGKPG